MLNKIGALSAYGLLAAILATAPAQAAVVVYSGYDASGSNINNKPNADAARDAYLAATAGVGESFLATFEGAPLGQFPVVDLGHGGTITSVDLSGKPQVIRNALLCQGNLCGYNTTPGGKNYLSLNGGTVTFSFADPIAAFGAFFTGPQFLGLQLTFSDGGQQVVDVPGFFGADFVGFTDFGKSISQVTFNATHDTMAMDDIYFTLAPPAGVGVPEPATWAMMILGFSLVGVTLRRRQGDLTLSV